MTTAVKDQLIETYRTILSLGGGLSTSDQSTLLRSYDALDAEVRKVRGWLDGINRERRVEQERIGELNDEVKQLRKSLDVATNETRS